MARTTAPHSATSQFYINLRDNFQLDEMKYAVFGEVTAGMETVDKIVQIPTAKVPPHANVPVEPVIILSVKKK